MKAKTLLILSLALLITFAWCNNKNEEITENAELTWEQNVSTANPASVYCINNGWNVQIETDDEWNQFWICMFEDWSYCDEWSYYRNECDTWEIIYNTVEEIADVIEENLWIVNPASVYCEDNWWTIKIENDEEGNETWLCMFEDGTYCDEWSYFREECKAWEIVYNTVNAELE